MTVLQVCAYGADYSGNFMASLCALEVALKKKGIQTIYAFVEKARTKKWCKELQKHTKVYFLPEAKARILPETYCIFRKIYRENSIDIVHSHFELYDIPATVTAPKNTKIFWHLHDPINPGGGLNGVLWKIQYGVVGKQANLISVSDYYKEAVIQMGFPAGKTVTVLNSIDLNRIQDCSHNAVKSFDFLTFGWDFYRKGDDLILDACTRLANDGYSFRLLLNGNEKTWDDLDKFLVGKNPSWLVRGKPISDINTLYSASRVFIQASRRETFSYAVCEAAYAGLPVISSNISGLEWAHALPSVNFFESENKDQLYILMKEYLDGKICSNSKIEKSRKIIRDNYSLEIWAEKVMKQYKIDKEV